LRDEEGFRIPKDEVTRKADLFRNGKKRFYRELDFIELLKTVRQAKMMFVTLFRTRQRALF